MIEVEQVGSEGQINDAPVCAGVASGRTDNRRQRFGRRRGNPGRPEDDGGSRRLRDLSHHGDDSPEHDGRPRRERAADRSYRSPVRRGRGGFPRASDQDWDVGDRTSDRNGRRLSQPLRETTRRRPRDGRRDGDRLLSEDAEAAYADLIKQSTLVTPNVDEAEILTETEIDDAKAAEQAGRELVDQGADAALVKGGHLDGDDVVDTLVVAEADGEPRTEQFSHPRIETAATHGSGCTLSSAIAARLARGESLSTAVAGGVAFMERAVRYGIDVGSGPGSVHHLVDLRERADRVAVSDAVEAVVARLVDRKVETLVPDIGMGVVGATRYAETPAEVVGVDGRICRTRSGIRPTAGVRSGGSIGLANQLLAARETFPELRFAVNCRFDAGVETALSAVDGPVVESETADVESDAVERVDHTAPVVSIDSESLPDNKPPAAVIDRGSEGRQPGVVLFGTDSETLIERTLTLYEALITE